MVDILTMTGLGGSRKESRKRMQVRATKGAGDGKEGKGGSVCVQVTTTFRGCVSEA